MRLLSLMTVVFMACGPVMMTVDAGGPGPCAAVAPNLLMNAGFECAADKATGWTAAYGTLEVAAGQGRTGNAAKMTATAAGLRLAYSTGAVVNGGMGTYCASAWVKGNVPFMRMSFLRNNGTGVEFSAPVTDSWTRVPPTTSLDATNDGVASMDLTIEAQRNRADGMNAMPGQVMYVDDVEVWLSANGRCTDHP